MEEWARANQRLAMRTPTLLLAAALAIAPPLASASAQHAITGVLTGTVRDIASSEPLPEVRIAVRGDAGAVIAATWTTAEGRYVLRALPPNRYLVEATRLGYAKAARLGVVVRAGDTTRLDFQLQPTAAEAAAVLVSAERLDGVGDPDVRGITIAGEQVVARQGTSFLDGARAGGELDVLALSSAEQRLASASPFGLPPLLLVDGRPASLAGSNVPLPFAAIVPLNDVARLTVVPTPGTTMYGASAGGGVVSVATTDPRAEPGNSLAVSAGSRGVLRLAARASATAGDAVGVKVTAETYDDDVPPRRMAFGAPTQNEMPAGDVLDQPDSASSLRSATASVYLYPGSGRRLVASAGFARASGVQQTDFARLQLASYDSWYGSLRGSFAGLRSGSLVVLSAAVTGNEAGESFSLDEDARLRLGGAAIDGGPLRGAALVDRSRRYDAAVQYSTRVLALAITSGVQYRHTDPRTGGTWLDDSLDAIRIDEVGGYVRAEAPLVGQVHLMGALRGDTHSELDPRASGRISVEYRGHANRLRLSWVEESDAPTTWLLHANAPFGTIDGLPVRIRGARDGYALAAEEGGIAPAPIPALQPPRAEIVSLGWSGSRGAFAASAEGWSASHRRVISLPTVIGAPGSGIFAIDPRTGSVLHEVTRTFLNAGTLPVRGASATVEWTTSSQLALRGGGTFRRAGHLRPSALTAPVAGLAAPSSSAFAGMTWSQWWRRGTRGEVLVRGVGAADFVSALPYVSGRVPAYTTADLDLSLPLPSPLGRDTRAAVAVENLFDARHVEWPGGVERRRRLVLSLTIAPADAGPRPGAGAP